MARRHKKSAGRKVYSGKNAKKRCNKSHKSCYKVKGGWSGTNK